MKLQLKSNRNRPQLPKKKYDNLVNDEIRARQVRVVSEGLEPRVLPIHEAIRMAERQGVDLVQITDDEIPVCKLIEFGKFCFQQDKKAQNASHPTKKMKEIDFHSNIADNDIEHKVKRIVEFLEHGHKVCVVCKFRGRENKHRDLGQNLFQKIFEKVTSEVPGAKRDGDIRENPNNIQMYLIKGK